MDELLELMEDAPPHQNKKDDDDDDEGDGGIDELALLLMDQNDEEKTTEHQHAMSSSAPTNNIDRQQKESQKKQNIVTPSSRTSSTNKNGHVRQQRHVVEASVDDRLGIRMLNRLVSSTDLSELITEHPYFSPATLSAMSLAQLNTLLLDPARIVDPATVAGRTNLVTVGMVFSNSGTRISSKGGGFCVVTIGNFASGPCVTLFLFGEVYGKFCRTCTPGKVVAVLGPKLLPASRESNQTNKSSQYDNKDRSRNNDSAISFSIYDSGQLKLVATARDYGTCQATVRVRQADGTWSSNGTCKSHVDKRVSEFCLLHRRRRQANATLGSSNTKTNKFQQLRQNQSFRVAPAVLVSKNDVRQTTSNRFLTVNPATRPLTTSTNRYPNTAQNQGGFSTNGYQHPSSQNGNKVPFHMAKNSMDSHALPPQHRQVNRGVAALQERKNTVSNSKHMIRTTPAISAKTHVNPCESKRKRTDDPGDWLKQAVSNKKTQRPVVGGGKPLSAYLTKTKGPQNTYVNNNQRRVNTDGVGFDGSVPVPKPTRIFRNSDSSTALTANIGSSSSSSTSRKEKQREALLQRQAEVAKLRMETPSSLPAPEKSINLVKENKTNDSSADPFLAAMGGFDHDKVRNAKSRFISEIQAEEYAASRQKVVELEKLEERQIAKTKKTSTGDERKRLTKAWRCKTCAQTFFLRPKKCHMEGHDVFTVRNIRKETTKEESRTALHNKRSDDGGLQLGAGLEWSGRYAGNRFLC